MSRHPLMIFSMHALNTLLLLLLAISSLAAEQQQAEPRAASQTAVMIEIRDAIGPATSDFFRRSLEEAESAGAGLFIVQLDTPGGLDTAMRDMIRAILASSVPVAIYVAPSGARAASAGTYLLYASHIAAMAPATNLGAATPVQMGGAPAPAPKQDDEQGSTNPEEPSSAVDSSTPSERKAINDSIAYIRGLAELRDRNADWAENAVRSAASLTASAALEQNVIDVVAQDPRDLLRQIDGRTVKVRTGTLTLATAGMAIERVETDWRTQLLAVITNPSVAYLLMLIGVYGLLLEGYNPGALLPGVVGGICLLLALYAFQLLSVNYAGLALIALGLALIIAEAFAPSFGALGLGGIVAFVIGSIILMDTDVPGFQIASSLIAGTAAAGGVLMLFIVTYFARSRRRPVVTGVEQIKAERVVALADFEREGLVRMHGEIWKAVTRSPVKEGEILRVTGIEGLLLYVEPALPEEAPGRGGMATSRRS